MLIAAWLACGVPGAAAAQQQPVTGQRPEHQPVRAPQATDERPADQNGANARPTHDPQPSVPPLLVLRHVQAGNETFVRHRRADQPPPQLAPRPAGAGRYVCAVVTCADFDAALAPQLGLAREDVLVVRVPGPFVSAETTALLERAVQKERVSLVLLLTHRHCEALQPPRDGEREPDAIDRRREHAVRDAQRLGVTLHDALLRGQREQLLTTSKVLREAVDQDRLRVLPGIADDRTAEIDWRLRRSDELPLAPVK